MSRRRPPESGDNIVRFPTPSTDVTTTDPPRLADTPGASGPATPALARESAREAYLHKRAGGASHDYAIQQVQNHVSDAAALLVPEWAREDGWDAQADRARTLEVLANPRLHPAEKLAALLDQEAVARSLLDETKGVVDVLRGQGTLYANPQAFLSYKAALSSWLEVRRQIDEAEATVRRRELEAKRDTHWRGVHDDIYARLKDQYDPEDRQPQYDVLCRNLARVETRLRQAEESGRDVPTEEYTKLVQLHTTITNQLQKYTESLKSEQVKPEVQEAILQTLTLVEREIGARYPEAFNRIVELVEKASRDRVA